MFPVIPAVVAIGVPMSENELNPYRPPSSNEELDRDPRFVYVTTEKTPPRETRIGFGFFFESGKVILARFGPLVSAAVLHSFLSFNLAAAFFISLYVNIEHLIFFDLSELAICIGIDILLLFLYFTWLLPGCIRFSLQLIRGEPDDIHASFNFVSVRKHLGAVGIFVMWFVLASSFVAAFYCSGYWLEGIFLGTETIFYVYIYLMVLGVGLLCVLSFFTGLFGIALCFIIDEDTNTFDGIVKAWKFAWKSKLQIMFNMFLFTMTTVLLSLSYCFGAFILGAALPFICLNFGMLYIGVTGQKHCRSPLSKESEESW